MNPTPGIAFPTAGATGSSYSAVNMKQGEMATVLAVVSRSEEDDTLSGRLAGMGILPGVKLQVLRASRSGKRPTLLAVGDTRIALGREILEHIRVKATE